MDNQAELLAIPNEQLKEDTLRAVGDRRELLLLALQELSPRSVREVIGQVIRSVPKINLDHPFGYYEIPVLTPAFNRACIKSPVEVKFVDSSHEALQPQGKKTIPPMAIFRSTDMTAYLNENDFTPVNRLRGWITGGRFGSLMSEEIAEHEIRHGLFALKVPEPFECSTGEIDEGFARATRFSHPFDPNDPWIQLTLSEYEHNSLRPLQPEEINGYHKLFKIVQVKELDDLEILKYMEKNNWWTGQTNDWWNDQANERYFYRPRIEGAVFKHIGHDRKFDIVTPDSKQKQKQLTDFRFETWMVVHDYLISHGLEFEPDWHKAIEEATQIRKAWDDMRQKEAIK